MEHSQEMAEIQAVTEGGVSAASGESAQEEKMAALMAQLNQFTRREHREDEVYLFDVRLCDNEIDRDGERFSLNALAQLQKLFVGRTGIFDHDPKGQNQTARIFAAELVTLSERQTAAGESYTYLKGHAYMVRTDANRDLIREIDGGIKKEVSISCAAASRTCSVCGSDRRAGGCQHRTGHRYGGKLCHTVLDEITDAYEWSFVAVPAQREAGVTKQYGGNDRCQALEKKLAEQAALLSQAEQSVRREIVRLRYLTEGVTEKDALSAAMAHMDLAELLTFQEKLRCQQKKMCHSQLSVKQRETEAGENGAFCL